MSGTPAQTVEQPRRVVFNLTMVATALYCNRKIIGASKFEFQKRNWMEKTIIIDMAQFAPRIIGQLETDTYLDLRSL